MTATLVIGRRYRGPLNSANGGYAAGALAAHVAARTVEVTLRLPPPLDLPLRVRVDGSTTLLLDGDEVVAEARPATLDLEVPAAVDAAAAAEAARRAVRFDAPLYAECFVCGERRDGDGLAIHVGAVARREHEGLMAAPWVADEPSVAVVWAAIDCPGAYAVGGPGRGEPVLGRMTARVLRLPRVGERCVVTAWPLAEDGRKLHAGTALWDEGGVLLAVARQVWIVPRHAGA